MNFFENQWVEVFRAGEQTDSVGNAKNWTLQDLAKIVANYDPQKHEAPVVVGHPQSNAPAFGWVESLKVEGDVLLAKFKQLVPEFVDAVSQGLYKKRSISLTPDLRLRHIGFLGAAAPAVKGLADIAFEENQDEQNFEFTNQEENTKMKNGENPKTENTDFQEKLSAKETENARLKAELAEIKQKARKAEFESFCEGLVKEGNITPAQKTLAENCFDELVKAESYEFAEDGKQPVLESMKTLLQSIHKQVEFAELAKKKEGQENSDFSDEEKLAERIAKA